MLCAWLCTHAAVVIVIARRADGVSTTFDLQSPAGRHLGVSARSALAAVGCEDSALLAQSEARSAPLSLGAPTFALPAGEPRSTAARAAPGVLAATHAVP